MKINVRFVCAEIVGNARQGEYEVPEGAAVGQFMALAAAENGTFVENYLDHVIYLIGHKPARVESVLKEGDSLMVLRMVHGG